MGPRVRGFAIVFGVLGFLSTGLLSTGALAGSMGKAVKTTARAVKTHALAPGVAPAAPPPVVPRFFLRRGGQRIESGLRIEAVRDSVRVADKVFPPGGTPQGLKIPDHLGGGYLFFQPLALDGSSATAFFRAETWTGPLRPLTRLPFAVRHVEPGFDRVYAMGVTLRAAFDVDSGDLLPLSPLPPLVTIEALSVAGPRRAVVQGPLVGVLYTNDAGQNWRPLAGVDSILEDPTHAQLFVRGWGGDQIVTESGELTPDGGAGVPHAPSRRVARASLRVRHGEQSVPTPEEEDFYEGPADATHRDQLERRWLSVLTQGARFKGRALALHESELLSLDLDAKLQLRSETTQVPATSSCVASAEEGARPIFFCHGETTQVFQLASDLKGVREVWSTARAARVLSHGEGGVLFLGGCKGGRADDLRACLVTGRGASEIELPKESNKPGLPRAWAVSSDQASLIWVERSAAKIWTHPLASQGKNAGPRRSWVLPKDHAVSQFLASGALLPRAAVTPEGLSLWATEREKFVGVLLRDAAEPSFGAVQRPLRRAILEGRHALVWGAAGFAKQSVDGGQTFSELTLPYRSGDPELASVTHPSSALLMGCTEVGCALGRLLKIGWDIPSETVAALPKARSFTIPGPSRFRFTCGRGPVKSGPRREGGSPDFPDFWEERAPLIPPGSEGLSVGFSGGLAQFYAWGPLEQGWARSGWAQAFFIDPWSPGKVRKTAATRQFFGSYLEAQTKLGIVDRISGVRYQAMDPEGDGGVMVVRGRTATELFVYDEGKPLESFGGGDELGSRNLIGAVRSRGVFVAAFSHGATLSLARLSDGEQKPLVDFPLGESGKRGVSLVRTEQGDLGIAMEGDVGLFIYPVSDDGDLGQPLVLPHASDRPASCPSEATGFIVDRELGVAPYLETTSGAPLPVTRVRERLIVGYGKACIAGLAGVARDLTPPSEAASHAQSIVLSILDTDSSGQRFELLCE